ncbi:hypothetical protein [Streptomyces sp. NPDC047071]|uniref:hypothetical protein n=1 Tax=Streptomyces sp. NPDC047071 TaxID=3154808 RepID=UPI003452CC1F
MGKREHGRDKARQDEEAKKALAEKERAEKEAARASESDDAKAPGQDPGDSGTPG